MFSYDETNNLSYEDNVLDNMIYKEIMDNYYDGVIGINNFLMLISKKTYSI